MWEYLFGLVLLWVSVIIAGGLGVTGVAPNRWNKWREERPLWTFRTLNRVAIVVSIVLTTAISLRG